MQFKYLLSTIFSLSLASGVLSTPLTADIAPRTNEDLHALELLQRSFPTHDHFSKDAILVARYLDTVVLNKRGISDVTPRAAFGTKKPAAQKVAAPKVAAHKAGSKGTAKGPVCSLKGGKGGKGGKRARAPAEFCVPTKEQLSAAMGGDPKKYFFYATANGVTVDTAYAFINSHPEYKGYMMLSGGVLQPQEDWDMEQVWKLASQIFAEKAEGTVYVLLPASVPSSSLWHDEKPILMASAKVKNLIQVDLKNNKVALKGAVPA